MKHQKTYRSSTVCLSACNQQVAKWFVLLLLLTAIEVKAQIALPLNREIIQRLEPALIQKDGSYFTVLKPYDELQLRKIINVDSILSFNNGQKHTTWLGRKLWYESFLQIDSADYTIRIDPVYNFLLGKELGNSRNLMNNTRGFLVRLRLGQTIGITSSFYENQTVYPLVWDNFIAKKRFAPGQSRAKRYHSNGWDYAYTTGVLTWKPKSIFSLQVGQDKNFIGEGYRSLLLSDVSSVYPFIKVSLTWKNFQYTRITALLQNIDYKSNNADTREFPQKTANFHLLSFNAFKHVQLSLFEGIILNNPSPSGKFKLDFDVLNPIPFVDVLFRSKSNVNYINSIAGVNLSWRVHPEFQLYGQFLVDDPIHKGPNGKNQIDQYGIQAGLKYFNVFNINSLYLQAEYNQVQPFTYSQGDSVISYSHFNQPLAHPLGANFYEFTGIANYKYHRIFAEYMLTYAKYGTDNNTGTSGHDILRPHAWTISTLLQGIKTTLITHQARLAWYVNPATNSCISIGIYWQNERSYLIKLDTKAVYLSFSTNLRNLYYDF